MAWGEVGAGLGRGGGGGGGGEGGGGVGEGSGGKFHPFYCLWIFYSNGMGRT